MRKHQVRVAVVAVVMGLVAATQGDRVTAQQALTGQLSIVWGDPLDGAPAQLVAYVASPAGEKTRLQFAAAAEPSYADLASLIGRTVTVTGAAALAVDTAEPVFQALRLERSASSPDAPAALDVEAAVTGAQPWVTLRCRFNDLSTTDRIVNTSILTGSSYPSLDEYWREASYNAINLSGSVVTNWVTLPQPRSFYIGSSANLSALANDCTAASDSQVNFNSFIGINMLFNAALDCCLWGGGMFFTLDGTSKAWRSTWVGLPSDNYNFLYSGLAHETGHGFGFPHSSGPYSQTYDSNWDVMSNAGARYEASIGQYYPAGTVSYHKYTIGGWIPTGRRFVPTLNSQTTISIERLAAPISTSNYLMAQIPIGGSSTQFYTVEFRDRAAHDTFVPGKAVVLHKVTTNQGGSHARVVDPDNNGNPNDAGAMWVADETFADSANGISVRVDSINATSATVTITLGTPAVGRSLLVNFGASGPVTGLWRHDLNGAWSPVHAVAPEAMAVGDFDANGVDDVAVDFGATYGLWLLYNNAAWVPLHAWSPTRIAVGDLDGNGRDDVIAHFAGAGLWAFYGGLGWGPIHSAEPSVIATANIDGTGGDDLVLVFPGQGTWVLRNNATWMPLSPLDASVAVGGRFDSPSGPDDLILGFPGLGLFQYSNNATWGAVNSVNAVRLAAGDVDGGGRDDVLIDFGPTYGIWSLTNGTAWTPIHASASEALAVGDLTGNGRADMVIDFGASVGLWARTDAGAWQPVHATSPLSLAVADLN